jgi:hypothetical protein
MTKSYLLDPFFMKCLVEAVRTPGLVAEYDRLRGTNLGLRGSELERAIDEATGRLDAEVLGFAEFVREWVYVPLTGGRKPEEG